MDFITGSCAFETVYSCFRSPDEGDVLASPAKSCSALLLTSLCDFDAAYVGRLCYEQAIALGKQSFIYDSVVPSTSTCWVEHVAQISDMCIRPCRSRICCERSTCWRSLRPVRAPCPQHGDAWNVDGRSTRRQSWTRSTCFSYVQKVAVFVAKNQSTCRKRQSTGLIQHVDAN
jgi:hypothetical protein